MKKTFLLAAFIPFLSAASAADLPLKAAPIVAPPCVWCGFYIGLNGGGSWVNNVGTYTDFPIVAPSTGNTGSGFIGGGQAGYNWQAGTFVFGVEGDIAWRNQKSVVNVLPFAPGNTGDQVNISNNQNWLGTVRPRVGAAFANVLIYATGGLAVGEVQHNYQEIRVTTGQARVLADSTTRTGWTLGAGIQWAFVPNWSLGFEYLHVDLGGTTLGQPASTSAGLNFPTSQATFSNKSDIARLKLDWQLGPK